MRLTRAVLRNGPRRFQYGAHSQCKKIRRAEGAARRIGAAGINPARLGPTYSWLNCGAS
jgi:hypothetical protein